MTGIDNTPRQLETARRMQAEFGLEFPLLLGDAEDVPLPNASFDLAISEYGASIWCDPICLGRRGSAPPPAGRPARLPANSTLLILCSPDVRAAEERLMRPQFGMHRFEWPEEGRDGCRVPSRARRLDSPVAGERLRDRGPRRDPGAAGRDGPPVYDFVTADWARRWPARRSGSRGSGVSAPPAPPILLASTSPQRRAILEQLGLPFEVGAGVRGGRSAPGAGRAAPSSSCARTRGKGVPSRSRRASGPCSGSTPRSSWTAASFGKPGERRGGCRRCSRRSAVGPTRSSQGSAC